MTRRFLRYLGSKAARYPKTSLLFAALTSIAAIVYSTFNLELEFDLRSLLPQDSKVLQTARQAEDLGGFDFMMAVLEPAPAAPESIKENFIDYLEQPVEGTPFTIIEEIAQVLDYPLYFNNISYRLRSNELGLRDNDAALVSLMTEEDWARLENRLTEQGIRDSIFYASETFEENPTTTTLASIRQDPFGLQEILISTSAVIRGPIKLNPQRGYYSSENGQMLLILLWPASSSTDLLFAQEMRDFLEEIRRGLFVRHPEWKQNLRISFAGLPIEATEGARNIRRDLLVTTVISLITVLVLFVLGFRQPRALFFIALTLIVGLAWTMGLTTLIVSRLTQITIGFAAILISLGIDFSIHLFNRFSELYDRGMEPKKALVTAMQRTGPGIVAGALTTGIAFFGLAATRFVGFRELGIVGGIGILMCLLAVVITLPPLLVLFPGKRRETIEKRRALTTFGLNQVRYTIFAYPRMTLIGGLAVAAFLGYHATQVEFDEDFRSLRQPSDSYVELIERINAHFQTPSNQVIILLEEENLQRALLANDQLYQNILASKGIYDILAIDSLRTILPSWESQKNSLGRMTAQVQPDVLRQRVEQISQEAGMDPAIFLPAVNRLQELQQASQFALERREPVIAFDRIENPTFQSLVRRHVIRTPNGYRIFTLVYPPKGEWVESIPRTFIDQLSLGLEIGPEVSGIPIISSELRRNLKWDLAKVVLLVFLGVIAYLWYHFRNISHALLTLIPVVYALLCMLGVINLLDIKLNFLNIIAIPIILGVGVDSGIHVLARYLEDAKNRLRNVILLTGRAIVITNLTTMGGFGSLIFANFQGIRQIGILCIIGVGFSLAAAIVILPAVLRMSDKKYLFAGGPGDQLG